MRIEDLVAIFGTQGPQYGTNNMWDPPKRAKDLKASNARFFRWRDGRIESITVKDLPTDCGPLRSHNVGSVFVHKETNHLLVTDINAAAFDVIKYGCHGKWSRLYFHHKRVTKTDSRYYTELDFTGTKGLTAANISGRCMPQLIPSIYNDPRQDRVNAGLIGKLPLLFAIAAFSAPKQFLVDVLTKSVRPGEWRPHSHPLGRSKFRWPFLRFPTNISDEEYRGMVVNICYDPANKQGSTKASLSALENGDRGPFYT